MKEGSGRWGDQGMLRFKIIKPGVKKIDGMFNSEEGFCSSSGKSIPYCQKKECHWLQKWKWLLREKREVKKRSDTCSRYLKSLNMLDFTWTTLTENVKRDLSALAYMSHNFFHGWCGAPINTFAAPASNVSALCYHLRWRPWGPYLHYGLLYISTIL